MLAEKLATAIELGPASTRVRDYADIYILTGTHALDRVSVRNALTATAAFRDTTIRPFSAAVQDIVQLRARTYTTYRQALGPDAKHLPEEFEHVVAAVIAFADPLITGTDTGGHWDPRHRRWDPQASDGLTSQPH